MQGEYNRKGQVSWVQPFMPYERMKGFFNAG